VRLVRGGQTVSSVAKTLGLSDQTLHNWLKAEAAGGLREITGKFRLSSIMAGVASMRWREGSV
jgi:transposase-like protein